MRHEALLAVSAALLCAACSDASSSAAVAKKLAIDLGGLHPPLSQTVDLDASAPTLGIVVDNTYPMDIFHAERHTNASNFRVQTTITCFVPPPK